MDSRQRQPPSEVKPITSQPMPSCSSASIQHKPQTSLSTAVIVSNENCGLQHISDSALTVTCCYLIGICLLSNVSSSWCNLKKDVAWYLQATTSITLQTRWEESNMNLLKNRSLHPRINTLNEYVYVQKYKLSSDRSPVCLCALSAVSHLWECAWTSLILILCFL